MSLSARLLHAWQGRGPLACSLWPLSLLYAALLQLRRGLYAIGLKHSTRLPVPVLVVGNVVVGGAGKTPTVIALVRHLRECGWTPGVISRGHGRQDAGCQAVTANSDSAEVGDEPRLIALHTTAPMVVGRQRVEAARTLLKVHPEVDIIVSDDGMQHWDLARDLTVVVFDDRATGNGWLLPAGLLREPWPARPWGTGSMLVLRNTTLPAPALPQPLDGARTFLSRRQLQDWALDAVGRQHPLAELPVHTPLPLGAFAGIAQPEAFFAMLRAKGLVLNRTVPLPDHADGTTLLNALSADHVWLCTEKDAVKLFPLLKDQSKLQVWAVPLQQTPEPAFFQAIDQALNGLSSAHGRQTP